MSEKTIHIYRVTHVAEYVVEDDGIYEDSVDMLRDVLGAARQGILEFEQTEHDFVAMEFDDDNEMKLHVIKVEGLVAPEKAADLPPTEPPPGQQKKLGESPASSTRRPARRSSRTTRRST